MHSAWIILSLKNYRHWEKTDSFCPKSKNSLTANCLEKLFSGKKIKMAITEARKTIAMCIGADPAEIYFTSCGTESDNWVIKMGSQGVEQVVTTVIEHHAVLNSCFCIEWI